MTATNNLKVNKYITRINRQDFEISKHYNKASDADMTILLGQSAMPNNARSRLWQTVAACTSLQVTVSRYLYANRSKHERS